MSNVEGKQVNCSYVNRSHAAFVLSKALTVQICNNNNNKKSEVIGINCNLYRLLMVNPG